MRDNKLIGRVGVFALICVSLDAQPGIDCDGTLSVSLKERGRPRLTAGVAKASVTGTCSVKKELGAHVLAQHSSAEGCKGPAEYNCEHGDLLYIYQAGPGQPLKAIYFDNEGHVIHYSFSTPTPTSAVLISHAAAPGLGFDSCTN